MGTQYDEDAEENITEEQARRLVQWVTEHGHTEAEANEALAYVMGAREKAE